MMSGSTFYSLCTNQSVSNQNAHFYDSNVHRMSAMSLSPSPSGDSQESNLSLPESPSMSVTLSPQSMQNLLSMTLEEQASNNIDMMYQGKAHLVIREQPIEKFRFRYKSEMMGTHGSIVGRSSDRSRRKCFPSVELMGFPGTAIIRCSLYTAHREPQERTLHTHRLIVKVGTEDCDDPHALQVTPETGYIAVFQGMGIIHTAKKNIADELTKKKQARLLEKNRAKNINVTGLTKKEEVMIREEAENEARTMDLNVVTLGYEAYVQNDNGTLSPICEPVFSQPIFNMKSALTGELKICRIDRHVSNCMGGDEVFMLVEKVGRKNIKVKFFEMDEDDNEIWYDFGKFSELDVHHQFAIVFRTPPYRQMDIMEPREVFLQLYRPSDGAHSEPIRFTYRPSEQYMGGSRKRPRTADIPVPVDIVNTLGNGFNFPPPNLDNPLRTMDGNHFLCNDNAIESDLLDVDLLSINSMSSLEQLLNNTEDQLPSAEFRDFMQNLSGTALEVCLRSNSALIPDDMDITIDGGSRKNSRDKPRNPPPPSVSSARPSVVAPRTNPPETTPANRDVMSGDDLLKNVVNRLMELMKTSPLPQPATVAASIRDLFEKKSDEGDCALHIAVRPENKVYLDKILGIISRSRTIQSGTLQLYISDILNSRNNKLETPLNRAVFYNQPATVAALLMGGACPNKADINGHTPLHIAVEYSHNKCLKELLNKTNYEHSSKRMYTNIKSEDGCSPLHMATRKRNAEAVVMLVEAGANVNEKDKTNGRTPLHIAVEEESEEIVRFLVGHPNISINEPNYLGNTALHMACVVGGSGSLELCKILLDAKANPMLPNYSTEMQEEDTPEPETASGSGSGSGMEVLLTMKQEPVDPDDFIETIGQTSFDLASNEKILALLQDSVKSSMALKNELEGADSKVKQEPPDCEPINLFDNVTKSKLCDILDRTGGWQILAELLDYKFLVSSIAKSASPSKLLFNYAEIRGTTNASEIREFLFLFSELEAVAAIDEVLVRDDASTSFPS